jgi:Transposase
MTRSRRIAEQILLAAFPTCAIPEINRLGKTLTQWPEAFLAYLATGSSSNGGTEAIHGRIELHRRIAAASATATTTGYACSSSEADSPTPTSSKEPAKSLVTACLSVTRR